ncbi:MAG: cytoplasmic protein [Desulfobacterales bacterium]
MSIHSHNFVNQYEGLVGFGLNRETDENTVVYYLQKFSDDLLMKKLIKRLEDKELEEIFECISRLLKKYLSEEEYHQLFLKEEQS